MNLCIPYMSVYMLGIGFNDFEVGSIASIYIISQMVFSFLSGALTDKLGRRFSVLLFDTLGWCVPCVVWIFAVDFRFFVIAALFNGAMKVPVNAWGCLLVEDTDKSQITRIYSLILICGHLMALFSPIASLLISRMTLIPAIRVLLINALVVMSIKNVLLYAISKETAIGVSRMRETKGQSYLSLISGYSGVLRLMRKSKDIVFSIAIASLYAIISMINTTFWQIVVSKRLNVSDSSLPMFTLLRAAITLFFFFTVISRINQLRLKNPLIIGFSSYLIGQFILVLTPSSGPLKYTLLILSLVFDGFGSGILATLSESMIAIHSDEKERARVFAIFQMVVMAVSSPFGWIGGLLSNVSRILPFIMNLTLIGIGVIITLIHFRARPHYAPVHHQHQN